MMCISECKSSKSDSSGELEHPELSVLNRGEIERGTSRQARVELDLQPLIKVKTSPTLGTYSLCADL